MNIWEDKNIFRIIVFNNWINVSHTNDILIERDIEVNDLRDRGKIYEIIKSMITEYLRYFPVRAGLSVIYFPKNLPSKEFYFR